MKSLLAFFSFYGFYLFVVIAGLLVLWLNWKNIHVAIQKRQFRGLLLAIIAISLIVVPFFQTKPSNILSTLQPSPTVTPTPTPFYGKRVTAEAITCPTSNVTGSVATNIIPLEGPTGDGKTDSYPMIQQAIIAAGKAGGGIVHLPAGTFLINGHLTMKDNVILEGVGPETIIKAGPNFLKNNETIGYSIVSTKGTKNITLRNFIADHQADSLDGNSVNRFRGFVINVVDSENVIVSGVYVRNPFAYAIMVENTTKFCIYNNDTQVSTSGKYDQLDGIHILNSSYGDVRNNYIDQGFADDGDDGLAAHTIDGVTHDVTFAHNTVRGGKGGAGMQFALTNKTDEIYNIKIQNNEFWGSPRGIRTGYYGGPDGSIHDILIGGSKETGNYIHDNIFNNTKAEDVINIYGNGIDPYNITVSYNHYCKAGIISVGKGKNNIVRNNFECT